LAAGEAGGVITLRRWFYKYGLLLVTLLAATGMADAAPQWRVLETPRFTVVSQISERETRAWAEEFNQFIEALKNVLKVDERFLPKLTVVIFDREKDFAPFRPQGSDGKAKEWVAAWFGRQDTWSVVGMLNQWENESMRRLIYQDGVHWFMSADQRPYPTWLSVGFAQLFSTFSVNGEKAKWGDVIEGHVRSLHRQKLIPFQQLLLTSQSDKLFNDDDRTSLFYAQSWAFVHYLVFGERKGNHGTLGEFLTASSSGLSTEEAFKKTFGMDFAAMESALDDYLSGGKFRMYSSPIVPSAKITARFEAASPALVQVALAKLAFSTKGKEHAQKYAEEAVRLDPTNPDAYKILAWVRLADASPDGFLVAAEKAVQLGAHDADAFMLLALARSKQAQSLGGIPSAEARQIVNLFEKAINLSPTLKPAYLNLGSILSQVDQPNVQDGLFLEQGEKFFPDELMLRVGRARLLRKMGNKEEALKLLQTVSQPPGALPADQQKFVQSLKTSWDVTDTLEQADRLLNEKNFKEALVLLDAVLTRGPTIEMRNAITQRRWHALASATMQEARAALANGQPEDAARLFQSVVDMERASANVRGQARQALQKLKGPGSKPAASPTVE